MIANNEMQLKALLKDLSSKYGITPQATLQMYCLERLLDRIAASRFRKHFVIEATSRRRSTFEILKEYPQVLEDIKADSPQNDFWRRFVAKNPFARGITLSQAVDCAKEMLDLTKVRNPYRL